MKWQTTLVGLAFLGLATLQEFSPVNPFISVFAEGQSTNLENSLSPEGWAYLANRAEKLQQRIAARPSIKALGGYGISPENDIAERSGKSGKISPNVGYARALKKGEFLNMAVDPAMSLTAQTALESEFGRLPTREETAARIAKSDAQIKALNQQIGKRRGELAKIYQEQGKLPQGLIADLVRPVMEAGTVPSEYSAENRKLDPAERVKREWDLAQKLINDLAKNR
jgi:hypothetical protein